MKMLQAIFPGGPFDRVLLRVATSDRKQIRGRLAPGAGIDELAELFKAPFAGNQDGL
jgi:hypothetical protein